MVFVINKNKKPLSPCSNAVARKLLKENKAMIHKMYPFTIRLKELKIEEIKEIKEIKEPVNETTVQNKQGYRLKIDYGSRYTGLTILNGNNVIWLAQLHHKINIKSKLDARRGHRRFRSTG